jgi:uncharacterized membrane protein
MFFTSLFNFALWAAIIEFLGTLFIVGYILAALYVLLRWRDLRRARLLVANGIIYALSLKVAASLLKTIELHSWQQISIFAAIFALRVLLKNIFVWETRELSRLADSSTPISGTPE